MRDDLRSDHFNQECGGHFRQVGCTVLKEQKIYLALEPHKEGQQCHQLCRVEDGAEEGQPSGEEGEVAAGRGVDDAGKEDEAGVDEVESGGEEEEGRVEVILLFRGFWRLELNILMEVVVA